jgi:hypothetical protein
MSGKQRGSAASRAVSALLTVGWKTVTGKEPPDHPEDPEVALSEALIWGVVLGAAVGAARLLATRLTTKRPSETDGD